MILSRDLLLVNKFFVKDAGAWENFLPDYLFDQFEDLSELGGIGPHKYLIDNHFGTSRHCSRAFHFSESGLVVFLFSRSACICYNVALILCLKSVQYRLLDANMGFNAAYDELPFVEA